jgi:G3E family GTPase
MKIDALILTGFLGSGKTSMLNRVLSQSEFSRSAVLVNEFGSVSLDHDMLTFASERVAVMAGGCICCSVREDVEEAVRHLFEQCESGAIPAFDRLIVETSGLADPVPLIHTFKSSPVLSSRLELQGVVATVDALNWTETSKRFPEALKQAALADTIVITKGDLAGESNSIADVAHDIGRVNIWARIISAPAGQLLTDQDVANAFRTSDRRQDDFLRQRDADSIAPGEGADTRVPFRYALRPHVPDSGISSFSMTSEIPLDWTAFGIWLTLLLHRYGDRVLRIKGLLSVSQADGPVMFHAVQHVVYPPVHADHWPSEDHRTRITFIVKDLDLGLLQRSLLAFNGLAPSEAIRFSGSAHHKPVGAGTSVQGHPVRRPSAPAWIK